MLEIRLNCENCDKVLLGESTEAMICTFECTFCSTCVEELFENVCPNCGGGFEKRPVRPKAHLANNPPRSDKVLKPVAMEAFILRREENKHIPPEER